MFALFYHVTGRFGKMIRQRPNLEGWGACKLCLPSGRPDVVFMFSLRPKLGFRS
jgi:hypothetical protein